MLVLEVLVSFHRTVQLQLLQRYWLGIDLDYCDIEWLVLEMNRDNFVIPSELFLFIRKNKFEKATTQTQVNLIPDS